MYTVEIFKKLILLTEKHKEPFNLKNFVITANNQEIGSQFNSFTAKTHVDTFIKLLPYLICAFILEF